MIAPYPGPRSPQVTCLWVIVPFRRRAHLPRVLENFSRQRFSEKRLLLIENGAAIGAAKALGTCVPTMVLESREHQSIAKNEALAYIRKQGGGFFTTMDDDDWYGPGYLDELAGYARSYEAIGKLWHFVSLGEGIGDPLPQLLLCNRRYADQETQWLTGGTISAWAEDAVDFPIVSDAEDIAWSAAMVRRGARIRALSIYHYLYRRSYAGATHTWKGSREFFLRTVSPAGPLEFPLAPSGDIDLEIVTGARRPSELRLVGKGRLKAIA